MYTNTLPTSLYSAQAVRALDMAAIKQANIAGFELMHRAAAASFQLLKQKWPHASHIVLLCGAGNNAGDGYLVAELLRQSGLHVQVFAVVAPERLQADAAQAVKNYKGDYLSAAQLDDALMDADVIVDALLGIGLDRTVEGVFADAIIKANAAATPVLALDVPSGLDADTGTALGVAIHAAWTITFIGLKQGLFTHQAAAYCGLIVYADLQVPEPQLRSQPASARLLTHYDIAAALPARSPLAYKNQHGHVLVIGGDYGMGGAAIMAAQAALRAGAGLVSVLTQPEHVAPALARQPELMVHAHIDAEHTQALLSRADVVVLGPGLGLSDWGRALFKQVLETLQAQTEISTATGAAALVLDADALSLLAELDGFGALNVPCVLTPHPGEAGRLLGVSTEQIQQQRFQAASQIAQKFSATVALKGPGTLVADKLGPVSVCRFGNAGMAVGGMGDVLAGMVGALLAQGLAARQATDVAVCLHAMAADALVPQCGPRGLLPTDLLAQLPKMMNPCR